MEVKAKDKNGTELSVGDQLTSSVMIEKVPLARVVEIRPDGSWRFELIRSDETFFVNPEDTSKTCWVKFEDDKQDDAAVKEEVKGSCNRDCGSCKKHH